jgi:hypothetical protein
LGRPASQELAGLKLELFSNELEGIEASEYFRFHDHASSNHPAIEALSP